MKIFSAFIVFSLLFLFPILFPINLYAQDVEEFRADNPLWRRALGGAVIGHPVAQAESVAVVTDGGNLKSYSSQGTPLWDYYAGGRLTPFVSRSIEGTSYICRTNGILIAINRSGRELWRINLGTPIVSPVLLGWDGRLFVFTDRKITCMTAAGYTLWSKNLENRPALAPVMDTRGGIILAAEDGKVLRFDPFGNISSYSPSFSASSTAVPAAVASLETAEQGHCTLLFYEDRHIELVYPSFDNGVSLGGQQVLPSSPLAAVGLKGRDEAAVLLRDGRIALFSLGQRSLLWTASSHVSAADIQEIIRQKSAAPERPPEMKLFSDERGIYLLTNGGASSFAVEGIRLWSMQLSGAASVPSLGDDGILFSGGADWILYSYRIENRTRTRRSLLYGEAPEGSYGTGNPGPSSYADYHYRFSDWELNARFDEIRRAIRDGGVGEAEMEYAAWLMETAGSLMANPGAVFNPPVLAHNRSEAARLLAFIGSRETIPFLASLFTRDPDIHVKAAAAEAIGRIGVDPDGLALRAFMNAVFPPNAVSDETVLTAIAGATGALCRFSGPPLSVDGVRLLTLLSGSDRPPKTRSQAQREIRSLVF